MRPFSFSSFASKPISDRDGSFFSFFMSRVILKSGERFAADAFIFSNMLSNGSIGKGPICSHYFLKKNYSLIADYFHLKLLRSDIVRPFSEKPAYEICRNLANFCGIEASLSGKSLMGGKRYVVYLEIIRSLKKLNLDPKCKEKILLSVGAAQATEYFFEHQIFQRALINIKKFGVINKKSIDRIKAGDPVIIPLGYLASSFFSLGHAIDVVFCGNKFVICNRGSKYFLRENVLVYQYNIDKLNIDIIKYLLFNFWGYIPNRDINGPLQQEIYLYQGLVVILDAVPLPLPPYLNAKNQKIANCHKANTLISFRVALFYVLHNKDMKEEEAALKARALSKDLSFLIRQKAIDRAKGVLRFLTKSEKKEMKSTILIAQKKLYKY